MGNDYAHDPAGLDRVATRFDELARDADKIGAYWGTYALPLAGATGKGLPALALSKVGDLTPGVMAQSVALHNHISTVSEAMTDTAEMFRRTQAENVERVRTIWNGVPRASDQEGRSSGGLKGVTLPSAVHLAKAPEPDDMALEKVGVAITTLLRDIEPERIFFTWCDKLLGGIFGERPTERLLEWVVGDWEALSKVSSIFKHFLDDTDLMNAVLIHTGKTIRTEGRWEGPSCETAFHSICGNANKVKGLEEIWRGAYNAYGAWASASYVMLNELQTDLAMIPSLILKGKKILSSIKQSAVVGIDIVVNTAQAAEKVKALLKELLSLAVAILGMFQKFLQVMFWILQAFYALMLTITAMLQGDANLDKAW